MTTELPTKLDGIIPLARGNLWVRSTSGWDSAGHPTVGMTDSLRIVGDTVIDNERWFLFNPHTSATNRSTGFYLLSGITPVQYLKYPASTGDSYPYGADTITVASLDTGITVTAGTFSCIRYEFRNNGFVHGCIFASPHNGMVRMVWYSRSDGGRIYLAQKTDLLSLHLN